LIGVQNSKPYIGDLRIPASRLDVTILRIALPANKKGAGKIPAPELEM